MQHSQRGHHQCEGDTQEHGQGQVACVVYGTFLITHYLSLPLSLSPVPMSGVLDSHSMAVCSLQLTSATN